MKTKKITTILAVSFMFTSVFASVVMTNSKNDGVVDSFDGLNLVNEERHAIVKNANIENSNATLAKESAYYSVRLGNNAGLRFKYVLTKDMIASAFSDANVDFENYTYGVYVAKTADLAGADLSTKIDDETVKKLKVEATNKVVTENDVTFAAVLVGFDDEVKYNTDFTAVSYVSNGTDTYYSAESGYSYMKAIEYYLDENNSVYDQLTDAQKEQLSNMKTDYEVSYRVVEEEGNFNLYQYSVKTDANIGAPIQTIAVPGPATYEINLKDKGSATENVTNLYAFVQDGNTFTSTNQGVSNSSSTMVVTATSDGTIAFDYKVQGEANYDYLSVFHNSERILYKISTKSPSYAEGSKSIDVKQGDTITLSYKKDSSSDNGDDCAVITFVTPEVEKPETSVVSFETNGAGVINPTIAMDGVLTQAIPEVAREGYYFDGWYTTSTFEEESKIDDSYSYVNDTKLYAHWMDMADAHPLMGTHYGVSVTSSSTSSNSYTTLEVDFHGNYVAHYGQYSNSSGTFVGYNEENDTLTTDSGKTVYYDATKGIVVTHHTSTPSSSTQYTIYVVGATSQIYSSKVSVAAFDSGAYRFVTINDTTNNVNDNLYIDAANNVVYSGVKAYDISENEISVSNISSQLFVSVKQNEEVLGTFGHNGSGLVTTTSTYGVYNVVGSEDTVTLTGADKLVYSAKGTSKLSYTVESENVYNISSTGSYNYSLTFDHDAMTVVVTENKYNVAYNWNGHEYEVSNSTYVWAGSWLYVPKPNAGVYVEEEGKYYVFQGWYADESLETLYKQTKITEDTTLYAKWVEGYKVTFDANGGTCDTTEVVVAGGTELELPEVTHSEKVFVSWMNNGVEFVNNTAITENVDLVASWKEAPFYAGTYAGYNEYGGSVGSKTSSSNSSYEFVINPNGKVTGKTNTTWKEANYVDGVFTFDNGAILYLFQSENGMIVGLSQYSFSTSSAMSYTDYAIYAKYTDAKPTFKSVYWNKGKNRLVEITLNGQVTYVYTDGENADIYNDVQITDFAGNAIAFADVYKDGALTSELVLTANGQVVAKCKATGETSYGYAFDDGRSGTYTGSLNGADATVVLDGYGYATVNGVNGTYTYDETNDNFTVVCDENTYIVEIDGTSLTQVLDGYQGTYAGAKGELVLTGWGEATLDGTPITYVVKSGFLAITSGEEVINVNVDTTNNTYSVASLSIFAGYTFEGEYTDNLGDVSSLYVIFDETVAISGIIWCGYIDGYASHSFNFTGTYDSTTQVLELTITETRYDDDYIGKVLTVNVENGKLTFATAINYIYNTQDSVVTCADFNL